MSEATDIQRWYFSPRVLELEGLTERLSAFAGQLMAESTDTGPGVVAATASEIIENAGETLPEWATDGDTRYLIIFDVPAPATMRLPSILGLRKPDRRMHVSNDPAAVRRLLIAQARSESAEGFVDAYVLAGSLVVILGDLSIRELPIGDLSVLAEVDRVADFRIDSDGSFLEWSEHELHVDPAGLLKEIDPEYQARLEIERLLADFTGHTLTQMRELAGLRQADIPRLSARHVRRIEKGVSGLTLDAARSFADAFGLELSSFLEELAHRVGELRQQQVAGGSDEVAAAA